MMALRRLDGSALLILFLLCKNKMFIIKLEYAGKLAAGLKDNVGLQNDCPTLAESKPSTITKLFQHVYEVNPVL